MNHALTIRLSAEAFQRLRQQAIATGTSPEELAAASLAGLCEANFLAPSDAGAKAARERFERHFGEIDLGSVTGADNDTIDADLAREYAGWREAE